MNELARKVIALISIVAIMVSILVTPAAADEENNYKVFEPQACASIGSWSTDRNIDLYVKNSNKFSCGATVNNENVQSVYVSDTDATAGKTDTDVKVNFIRFNLDETNENVTYMLTLKGGEGVNTSRRNPIKWYVALAQVEQTGILNTPAIGDIWANSTAENNPTISWLNRPQLGSTVIDAGITSYNTETNLYSDFSVDVTSLLEGKSGNVTIALLNEEANENQASQSVYSDAKLIRTVTSPLTTDTAVWAQDIIDRGTAVRGTDGNNNADNIGAIKDTVTDEQLAVLGLFLGESAVRGTAVGSKVRLNALDCLTNETEAAKYNGYIEDTINAAASGTYDIYILGTGAVDRKFAITINNTTPIITTAATDLTSSIAVHQHTAEIELKEGENIIHIQAPEGQSAPNFIALYVKGRTPSLVPEDVPGITIDYENEKLTGFGEGSYTVNDSAITSTDGTLAIDASYFGTQLSIVKKGNGATTTDSAAQSLDIPARPSAPIVSELNVTQPSAIGGTGTITIPSGMEYSTDSGNNWSDGTGTEITNIAAGTEYKVRKKAVENKSFKSAEYSVTITAYNAAAESTPEIGIDYDKETLTNFTVNSKYAINSEDVTPETTEISATKYIGSEQKTISIVKKGDGITTKDSNPQSLDIPARPDAPTGVLGVAPSEQGGNGKLTGMANMQYRLSEQSDWTDSEADEVSVAAGEYKVRKKATESAFASAEITVTVPSTVTYTVTAGENVSVSKSRAEAEETITVTVEIPEGKVLTDVKAGETSIFASKNADGKFSFTMPSQKVEVAAVFEDKGKVALYTMDDKTELTYFGDSENVLGQKNNAVNFIGGYASLSEFPLRDNFTFSAWIKPETLNSWERLFDFGSGQSSYIFFTAKSSTGKPRLAVKLNGGSEEIVDCDIAFEPNDWSYVTVTLDNSTAKIYINGKETGSGTVNTRMFSLKDSQNNYLAKSQYSSDAMYQGCIDEVYIYNYALTADEIKNDMSSTAATISSIEQINDQTIYIGETPSLPASLTVTYTNGMTAKAAVKWETPASYDTAGELTINGTAAVSGTEINVTAKIIVKNSSSDENYNIGRGINYVKNSGISYADAIYSIKTENTDELTIAVEAYKNGVKIGNAVTKAIDDAASLNGSAVGVRLPITENGQITVKSSLYKTSSPEIIISEAERTIDNKPSFADTSSVELEKGSLFETSEQTGLDYILGVDVARLLKPSFEMHGISLVYEDGVDVGQSADKTAGTIVERYGGWEMKGTNTWGGSAKPDSFTLAGEHMGHWLSAAAVFYRDLKDAEDNAEDVKKLEYRMDYIIDKLDALQNAEIQADTAVSQAYIGGCPENTFTKCFAGDTSWADGYWVPWYGIHKIYQGLLDVYDYASEETALKAYTVLKKFTDWAVDGTANLTDAQLQSVLDVEYGGMNEIFARMYEITGEEKYLSAARRFTHDSVLTPLEQNKDSLGGLHANTTIPKVIGAAEIYEQNPETYAGYKDASVNFWHIVNDTRCYAIGGNSISEHFEKSASSETLGIKTCESCNTYNMMRLTEHLFSWEQKTEYMDWYEKALYNHILGQQEPETGAKMYFVSLLQGHHRIYEDKYNSWWCCTGTGMENPGRYTRAAYYEDNENDALYVSLYMPGTYSWTEKGLNFKIETNYPYSENVKITVTGGNNINADIKFRAPGWLKSAMTAAVNDETAITSNGGEYLSLNRAWNTGDVINITIPMEVRTYTPRTENQTVYEYGPIVLAADLGECQPSSIQYTAVETKLDSTTVDAPYIVTNGDTNMTEEKLVSYVETDDASKLSFHIKAENSSTEENIALKPFHEITHSFHNVYWNLNSVGNVYEKNLNNITIDAVEPDGQQDELGHGLAQNDEGNSYKNSHQGSFTGSGVEYKYRDAYGSEDAFFQYTMKVNKDIQNYLFVRYWGSDTTTNDGKRDFNIYINGELLANQTLDKNNPNNPYDVFYEIPKSITENLTADGNGEYYITVKFAPTAADCIAGGVLGVRTTTAGSVDNNPTEPPAAPTTYTVTITVSEGINNVKLGEKEGTKDGNTYTFTGIEAGDYTFDVAYAEGYEKATESPESITVSAENLTGAISAQKKKYTVTFMIDGQDTPVEVEHGATAQSQTPQTPTKEGYHFVGWVKGTDTTQSVITEWDIITENGTVYTAKFEEDLRGEVKITFSAGEGGTLTGDVSKTITEGGNLTAEDIPTASKTGYTFDKWSDGTNTYSAEELVNLAISSETTFTATYTINKYTITWNIDGTTTTEEYEYNATPSYKGDTPTKAATAQYTYTFKDWGETLAPVTADKTYTAVFTSTVNKYTITWKVDGQQDEMTEVEYGATPTHADPTKDEDESGKYVFKGWSPEIAAVTGEQTYTAQFDLIAKYTIIYNTDGGTINDESYAQNYYAGEGATLPTDVTKDDYYFAGWYDNEELSGTAVATITTSDTGNKTYYAKWTQDAPTEYSITFVNYDNTELQSNNVAVGTMPSYNGATPTTPEDDRYIYEFAGWSPEITAVSGIATYKATFRQYMKPLSGFADKVKIEKSGNNLIVTSQNDYALQTLMFYTAIYNSDKALEKVTVTSCEVNGNGNIVVPFAEPQTEEGESYKLMLWTNDMSPVIDAINSERGFFNK